jgi:phage tail-like protein
MPNDLVLDPIVARNFTIEFDGQSIPLTGISGMEIEVEVVPVDQNLPGGMQIHHKTRGGAVKTSDVTLTRLAPQQVAGDPIWDWFITVRTAGPGAGGRKHGSIKLVSPDGKDTLAQYDFEDAWIAKITTSDMSSGSTDPLTESILLVSNFMVRVQ